MGPGADSDAAVVAEIVDLARPGDYFTLRERLEGSAARVPPGAPADTGAVLTWLRAEMAHAFNDPAESNRRLRRLEPLESLPDSVQRGALRLALGLEVLDAGVRVGTSTGNTPMTC